MWYFHFVFPEEIPSFSMLDLHMAMVTADELLMNGIHSEQEMENRAQAICIICSSFHFISRHNQHLNETECFQTHSPTGFIQLCCEVGKDTERGERVIVTIRVHSGVQSIIVLKSFLVRHFHGAINRMEVHKM